jgi:hypothetical protein
MTTSIGRAATLRIEKYETGPVLKATVPTELSVDEFAKVAQSGYELIHRLTGCNCLSGRISFVVDENWAETVRVEFER